MPRAPTRPAPRPTARGRGSSAERRSFAWLTSTTVQVDALSVHRGGQQAGWELSWKITESPLIVVAPHGGSIELRTSEIATAIADGRHTECHFKGRLPAGNYPRLHVTSTNWDVEECLILIRQRPHALSIHGTAKPGRVVYVGGRDTVKGAALTAALRAQGFQAEAAPDDIAGLSTANFVNKDADGARVTGWRTRPRRCP
ncbi:poly-gamma-glutamate hydrolase family protein [Micromonospora sp. NPDC049497]|uniref:poly-gamma-glutamate hydrolase family protein n=1 Tax=Micromonospora sp. NPDC049497 TaxID=3364273 RepID=UPI0037A34DA8